MSLQSFLIYTMSKCFNFISLHSFMPSLCKMNFLFFKMNFPFLLRTEVDTTKLFVLQVSASGKKPTFLSCVLCTHYVPYFINKIYYFILRTLWIIFLFFWCGNCLTFHSCQMAGPGSGISLWNYTVALSTPKF